MQVVRSCGEMQAEALTLRRSGKTIGLVPTMGALHEGHLSLVRLARREAGHVIVSLFVNPSQFGPAEDFTSYPRDFERDRRLCAGEGVDTLFCPSTGDVYAADHSTSVEEGSLSAGLCGRSRPGHFKGVATVVAKLFNLTLPDVAVFGRKDAQQVRVIERMVRDLNFPVRIVAAPIVRESDGLAMSSRNAYLAPEERAQAAGLYQALRLAETLYRDGVREAALLREHVAGALRRLPGAEVEYVEILDYEDLRPALSVSGPALVALCVRFGKTRLIDNAVLGPG